MTKAERKAEMAILADPDKLLLMVADHINEHFGPRCTDFDPHCATCVTWKALDIISGSLESAGAFEANT